MTKAEQLNEILRRDAPAAAASLSRFGQALAFPQGIPSQTAEAAGCELKATIGQLTDGFGHAMAVDALASHLVGIEPEQALLYGNAAGLKPLRELWRDRQAREGRGTPTSLPAVVCGLTHGLSVAADLFLEPGVDVLVPTPYWGNYRLLFEARHGARIVGYPFFDAEQRFNTAGLAQALAGVQGRAVVLLNFPSNPQGFSPRLEDVAPIVELLVNHPGPLVVVLDDAYHGIVFEDGALRDSLFWALARRADPARLLVVKVDGCTKELLFFGGRVGFITFSAAGEAGEALVDKVMASTRSTVSIPPGPSQALALAALRHPEIDAQIQERLTMLRGRWEALQAALATLPKGGRLKPLPNNAGFFGLVSVDPDIDVQELRLTLIRDHSVGVISIPEINALRLAFCSTRAEDMPELIHRIQRAVSSL
ncbi:MAG: hypothetical protein RIT28_711 [Pseudomonadota bacterium]